MRLRGALVAALAAGLLVPASAGAHGGDAEAALVAGRTSYPIGVPQDVRRALDGQVLAAARRGYPVKVAVVHDRYDVNGNVGWAIDPQAYADHLAGVLGPQEQILVVGPGGLGGTALGERPAEALGPLQGPIPQDLGLLAGKAMQAVATLTAANGTPVAAPPIAARLLRAEPAEAGEGSAPVWLMLGGPLVLVAGGLGVASLVGRRREQSPGGSKGPLRPEGAGTSHGSP